MLMEASCKGFEIFLFVAKTVVRSCIVLRGSDNDVFENVVCTCKQTNTLRDYQRIFKLRSILGRC